MSLGSRLGEWTRPPSPSTPEPISEQAYRRIALGMLGVAAFFFVGNLTPRLVSGPPTFQPWSDATGGDWGLLILLATHVLTFGVAAWMRRRGRSSRAYHAAMAAVVTLQLFAAALVLWANGSVTSFLSQWFTLTILFVRLYFDAKLGLWTLLWSVTLQVGMVLLEVLHVIPAHPAYPDFKSPEYATAVAELGRAFWLVAIYVGAWVLASYAAWRIRSSEDEVRTLNAVLEQRVQEQVSEIKRHLGEVDALNTQLQERVRERSRELGLALRRLAAAAPPVLEGLRPGMRFADRVEIIRPIGAGGMGAVYLGTDQLTGRLIAVKLIHRTVATADAMHRFLAEASTAAAISHPGIIKTIHVDVSADGQLYILLEYVEGQAIDQRLVRGPLGAGKAARIGAAVADALAAAHEAGVIHRDIKPSNVLLCNEAPGVKVLDFGLAKIATPASGVSTTQMTRTNQLLGTPEFMSPEQVRDASSIEPASDVYSFGLLIYCAATGSMPYDVSEGAAGALAHLSEAPRPLRAVLPDAPVALEEILAACLAKEAHARPSARTVASRLAAIADALGVGAVETLEDWREPTAIDVEAAETVSVREA